MPPMAGPDVSLAALMSMLPWGPEPSTNSKYPFESVWIACTDCTPQLSATETGSGTGWPDVIVAAIMGGLGLWGGWQIVSQARGELRSERTPIGVAAE